MFRVRRGARLPSFSRTGATSDMLFAVQRTSDDHANAHDRLFFRRAAPDESANRDGDDHFSLQRAQQRRRVVADAALFCLVRRRQQTSGNKPKTNSARKRAHPSSSLSTGRPKRQTEPSPHCFAHSLHSCRRAEPQSAAAHQRVGRRLKVWRLIKLVGQVPGSRRGDDRRRGSHRSR